MPTPLPPTPGVGLVPINSQPIGAALNRLVKDTLSPSQRGMFELDVTKDGAEVELAQKFGKNWTVGGYAQVNKARDYTFGARVTGAW